MTMQTGSRHSFTLGYRDEENRLYLTEREPYRYTGHTDTREHTVVQGDTLFDLAGRYFEPMPRACGFWWVIADFQPDPIIDPTIELELGRVLYIPSPRVLTDVILCEQRARLES
jgi:hypothetical protein